MRTSEQDSTYSDEEAGKRAYRQKYLQDTYGISLAEFEAIVAYQGSGCAGCGSVAKTRNLHVDHDHKTGAVRGVLCAACNSALRKLRDSPEIAKALAKYLKTPPANIVLGRVQLIQKKVHRRRRRTNV